MKIILNKTLSGFVPADTKTAEWHAKLMPGQSVWGDFTKIRNYKFLKKYFALLNIGFDNWIPGEINSKYGTPEKNFDQFRDDCTIKAGYFYVVVRLDGSIRIKPKSISFAKMEEDEFSELYSKTIDVLLKYVYGTEMDAYKINEIVESYLRFA